LAKPKPSAEIGNQKGPEMPQLTADEMSKVIDGAIATGREVERERCAKIADAAHAKVQDVGVAGPYVASEIAAAIRNQNK
jgi:hypothetical protein